MSSGGKRQIEIQDRDVALLRTLYECRVMTRLQAALLHFDGKTEAAKKRIQLLKGAGYLSDRPRFPLEPAGLMLTRKGYELLDERGVLQEFPAFRNWKHAAKRLSVSPLTIQHELEVIDFRAAIVAAVRRQPNLSLTEICTWPAMIALETFDTEGRRVEVCPDGCFHVTEQDKGRDRREHFFFLEVDRSTERQSMLIERMVCYRNYYRQLKQEMRSGRSAADKPFPFRVLVTCKSRARCNELLERLSFVNIKFGALVWITASREARRNPLGAIWMTLRGDKRAIVTAHWTS